ncbi:MAG TPA: LysR family transcriptional regulator [Trebonia sp.]|nr:LysR family transcriptional regulator [Trebonia sp.]
MDTDVLRWFKLVADGATVTEVSDLEPVTQSGVSRGLARLEAEVGTPLLQRSGRTLTPTPAGEVFRPFADGILQQLGDGLAAVSQFVSPDTGTITVAFQQSLGSWLVPDLVRTFRGDHPDVRFSLTQVHDELWGLPLNGGRTDLEVGTRRFRTGREAIRPGDLAVWTRQIGMEPLRLALPRDHPLAERRRIALADVAAEPFIGLRTTSALRELGDELCKQAGFRPTVVFEGDDLSIVRGLVAAGLGVAIVPAPRAGSPEASPGPVRYAEIIDDGAERAIYLTWPADRPLLPAADLFRKHVLRTVIAGRIRPVSDFT